MTKKKSIDFLFPLLPPLAWLLTLLIFEPLSVTLALLSAMLAHEGGHLFAFFITRSGAPRLVGEPCGFVLMPKRPLSYLSEVIVALFGPLFNLLLALTVILTSRPMPNGTEYLFFFLNLASALYNLLPISFLDGGRIIFSLCAMIFPLPIAEKIISLLSVLFLSALLFFSLFLIMRYDSGYGIFISVVLLITLSAKKQT